MTKLWDMPDHMWSIWAGPLVLEAEPNRCIGITRPPLFSAPGKRISCHVGLLYIR
jgi:hypothetical protein